MTTFYVDAGVASSGNGLSQGAAFKTIQEAVSAAAASGDTINVAAGTYNQALDINKSVTILGANHGIDGTGARGAETIIVSSASLAITLRADNVTIDGVTVIGNGDFGRLGNADPAPVTGAVITNNIVTVTDPLGWGVYFYNDGTPTVATISHNLISGGQIGVVLYNNSYGSVTDNTITDVERGVQTGNMYLPSPLPGDAEISHNHISAEIVGIYHNLSYGTASRLHDRRQPGDRRGRRDAAAERHRHLRPFNFEPGRRHRHR